MTKGPAAVFLQQDPLGIILILIFFYFRGNDSEAIKWKKDKKKQNQAKIYTFATIILIYHRMRLHVIC